MVRRIGRLRHYVTIHQLDGTATAAGDIDQSDTSVYRKRVPCEIRDIRGQEGARGNQVDATATHTLRTRFDDSVTTEMWAVDSRAVRYNFVAIVDEDGRQREMVIHARTQQ